MISADIIDADQQSLLGYDVMRLGGFEDTISDCNSNCIGGHNKFCGGKEFILHICMYGVETKRR